MLVDDGFILSRCEVGDMLKVVVSDARNQTKIPTVRSGLVTEVRTISFSDKTDRVYPFITVKTLYTYYNSDYRYYYSKMTETGIFRDEQIKGRRGEANDRS